MRTAALLLSLLFSYNAASEQLAVEYKRFYSHVKKLDNEDTQALQFSFGFLRVGENRLCKINNAQIVTDKKTLPLNVTPEYRFTVPDEKVLKMADAQVMIDLDEPANVCDMSVQLETRPEYLKQHYTAEDLTFLMDQYTAFFNEMGSFLSFLMPSVEGLMVHFNDQSLDFRFKQPPHITQGTMLLDKAWLNKKTGLELPQKPLRITAIAQRN